MNQKFAKPKIKAFKKAKRASSLVTRLPNTPDTDNSHFHHHRLIPPLFPSSSSLTSPNSVSSFF
ncbi:uncharacterized protein DS421_13g417270 [Arachis hypogaea]|nr:uncharacterized protein DS421_13g417270 [Arachis hypogaea]